VESLKPANEEMDVKPTLNAGKPIGFSHGSLPSQIIVAL